MTESSRDYHEIARLVDSLGSRPNNYGGSFEAAEAEERSARALELEVKRNADDWNRTLPALREIRLVTIDPSNLPGDQISCRVAQASFTTKYIAISYAWGDNTLSSTIILNGRPSRVTSNCEQLLRALRHQQAKHEDMGCVDPDDRFWIDALCIDQHNVTERNSQVAQMDMIYSTAQRTIIYLGEHDEHSAAVLPDLGADRSNNFEKTDGIRRHPPILPDSNASQSNKRKLPSDFDEAKRICQHIPDAWGVLHCKCRSSHVESFSDRAWFHRTWVAQELLLARDPTFLISSVSSARFARYGSMFTLRRLYKVWFPELDSIWATRVCNLTYSRWASTSLEDLRYRVRALGEPPMILGLLQAFSGLEYHYRLKGRLEVPLWTLHTLMDVTSNLKCSDARDKIFAILSLLQRPLPELLQPDYSKTVCATYTDAMWFMINYGGSEPLMAAGSMQDSHVCRSIKLELPSWVLDFGSRHDPTRIVANREWHAGFAIGHKQMVASRYGQTLTIRGLQVAMIASLIDDKPASAMGRWTLRQFRVRPSPTARAQRLPGFCGETSMRGEIRIRRNATRLGQLDMRLKVASRLWRIVDTLQTVFPDIFSRVMNRGVAESRRLKAAMCALSSNAYTRKTALGVFERHALLRSRSYSSKQLSHLRGSFRGLCGVFLGDGRFAIAPLGTQVGDAICVLLGVERPMVLRPSENSAWQLVGQCFVADLMYGQAVRGVKWETIGSPDATAPLQDFQIR